MSNKNYSKMDIETLNKGIRIAKILEDLEKKESFVSSLLDDNQKSRPLKYLHICNGDNSDQRVTIDLTRVLTQGLSSDKYPDELEPAIDAIRQATDAAIAVIHTGLKRASEHVNRVFTDLKPVENDSIK